MIMYTKCPVLWCSKLQTEIILSTTEAEHTALSQATRDVLPFMDSLKEINEVFPLDLKELQFYWKVSEDNYSCISLVTAQKFSPRTKHMAIKYHHFRRYYVRESIIEILLIPKNK